MGLFDLFKKNPAQPAQPDPEVERLIQALSAPAWEARFEAANSLAALGVRAEAAQNALENATSDEHNEVCTAAAAALSAIRRALDVR